MLTRITINGPWSVSVVACVVLLYAVFMYTCLPRKCKTCNNTPPHIPKVVYLFRLGALAYIIDLIVRIADSKTVYMWELDLSTVLLAMSIAMKYESEIVHNRA